MCLRFITYELSPDSPTTNELPCAYPCLLEDLQGNAWQISPEGLLPSLPDSAPWLLDGVGGRAAVQSVLRFGATYAESEDGLLRLHRVAEC